MLCTADMCAAGLRDERDLSVGARLTCGAIAGTTGQTVAYPFDVARRRLQVGGACLTRARLGKVLLGQTWHCIELSCFTSHEDHQQ
jgi:hypothetical protein